MSDKYNMTGRIKFVNETQTFKSGFQKREFVIESGDDKYPQMVKFEVTKDKCESLDKFDKEQEVEVSFNIRGNEYNGKYYVNLQAWRVESTGQGQSPVQGQNATPSSNGDEDDIPF